LRRSCSRRCPNTRSRFPRSGPCARGIARWTRELSDALRRRCLYHYLDYPSQQREIAIVRATLPDAETRLVEEAVDFVQRLRKEDLQKTPGIAETLDWVRALHQLRLKALPEDPESVLRTLSCLLKTREDRFMVGVDQIRRIAEGPRSGVAASPA
jgi:MoxR-like ATPase